jgi:hypothetical protein
MSSPRRALSVSVMRRMECLHTAEYRSILFRPTWVGPPDNHRRDTPALGLRMTMPPDTQASTTGESDAGKLHIRVTGAPTVRDTAQPIVALDDTNALRQHCNHDRIVQMPRNGGPVQR